MALEKKDGLVIVESPAKARTINKILGKNFAVKASIGHIKDLPKKELGVDTSNEFSPKYIVIPGKEKVIKELREAAKKASSIYLAPDPDREGEAIAWHISEVISGMKGSKSAKTPNIYRITFNEITKRAVSEAINSPSLIDKNKVYAQQARRILDRLVGYGLSPLLWKKVKRGLSAGRVQSVAVRLIVDREKEIESFNQEEYWNINGLFEGEIPPAFRARLFKYDGNEVIERSKRGNKYLITTEKDAESVVNHIKGRDFSLKNIEKKAKKRSPSPPFITSTLQQEASRRLRYSAKKTMMIAQQLYEGIELGEKGSIGLITYMRTDSTRIAPEAVSWAREFIVNSYGKDYIPSKQPKFKVRAAAQEAHEAIRPTYMENDPLSIKKFLSRDQYAIYEMIWKRFIACQMSPAKLEQTVFEIADPEEKAIFSATGTIMKFKGYMLIYSEGKDESSNEYDSVLPNLQEGVILDLIEIEPEQNFTQPPPRYSEATLIKALEEKGVGRPSTYAAILSTIEDRKYVEKEERRFKPSELGVVVNDLLVERFPELIDVKFTAKMEDELDRIEEGASAWSKVIEDFYTPFNKELEVATINLKRVKPEDKPTDITCEKCEKPMVIRWGRHGRFMACSGFPECKNTKPLEKQNGDKKSEPQDEKTNEICEKCGSQMVLKKGRYGRFLACSKYPDCKNIRPLSTGIKCPGDGGDIIERRSKKGKLFYSCSNYPECKFATWYKPVSEQCPDCGANFLVEKKNKEGNTVIFCINKVCKYKREESG